ncbi:DUF418 domain-containing protein [Saccharomonospora xinjiangensis]|uniref:DUF418 domain-containing protein n=1 Tax=Saccharomonospora xinjiangensis TaxID=75294 RepID=UPI00106FC38A|nr:DUF418 domain-containing protein [Saccharomonospora xinjiangensis]QBQ58416.1 hypothetical protein EYD13_00120 [Saccharomonospora xinjiangensis]
MSNGRNTTARPGRIDALDLARGIAILGTLATNIWIFTDPAGALGWLALDVERGAVETLLLTLSNGKFLALLSILFGVGLELQYRSAVRRGLRWPGRYLWRATLLLLEGVLHYLLIFEFDVLTGYALVSVHVAFLVSRSDRVRRTWLAVAAAVHVTFVGLLTAASLSGALSGAAEGTTSTGGAEYTAIAAYSSASWLDQVRTRIELAGFFRLEILLILPLSTVLFLAGIEVLRAGAFEDSERGSRVRRRLLSFGLGAGVPLNLVTAFAGPDWFFVDRYIVPPIVAFGLLAAVVEFAARTRGGVLRRGLIATGRAAMSCYVLQNLVAGALCYGWGLGLATLLADARPWWVLAAWAFVSALLMTLAALWLRAFSRGPLELLLHRLYTGRPKKVGEPV